jgi:hypothetical protein
MPYSTSFAPPPIPPTQYLKPLNGGPWLISTAQAHGSRAMALVGAVALLIGGIGGGQGMHPAVAFPLLVAGAFAFVMGIAMGFIALVPPTWKYCPTCRRPAPISATVCSHHHSPVHPQKGA